VSLVTVHGARRSGKSVVAEQLAGASGAPVVYIAPLTVTDDELAGRVAAHRARRPAAWTTVESADPLAALVATGETPTILLDSLGTWISETLWRAGALEATPDATTTLADLAAAVQEFAARAAARRGLTVVVAEEAGWGPVPPDPSTRRWLDAMGDAARACSARADRALLVVAGRIVELP
jgi:adenosylcobinamide kinase/adenosylcobinamide-phosphate guanylyltransferase